MTRRVLVTRPAAQAPALERLLRDAGIDAICVPTVAVETESATAELDAALGSLDGAAWLVVTSQNGARAIARRLAARGRRIPVSVRVAAVGPTTASALNAAGIAVDHVPNDHLTAAIAGGLGDVADRRVVLARADAATPELREALVARGARVEEVVAYRTIEGPARASDALRAALRRDLDGIAFTSASAVRGLMRLASTVERGRARNLDAFCIGPVTAGVARDLGFEVATVADPHTAKALAASIAAHFRREVA